MNTSCASPTLRKAPSSPLALYSPALRVRTILQHWLPVVAWAATILLLGSNGFSSSRTGEELSQFLPFLSSGQLDTLNWVIRKCAHFTEYGLLGWVTYRATTEGKSGWNGRAAVVAVLFAAGIASLDEWHQSFVASRTSSPLDALLDTAGAIVGQTGWRRR